MTNNLKKPKVFFVVLDKKNKDLKKFAVRSKSLESAERRFKSKFKNRFKILAISRKKDIQPLKF